MYNKKKSGEKKGKKGRVETEADDGSEKILYETRTHCPRCTLSSPASPFPSSDSSSPSSPSSGKWIPARVVSIGGRVWVIGECAVHGGCRTLYCSDTKFFLRMVAMGGGLELEANKRQGVADVEGLVSALHPSPEGAGKGQALPFSVEVALWDPEKKALTVDAILLRQLETLRQLYAPARRRFVLNVTAKISTDISGINAKVALLLSNTERLVMTLEATYERLVLIAALKDSVLLNRRVFPSIKHALVTGHEGVCIAELDRAVTALSQIDSIQIVLTLSFSLQPPLPDLAPVLYFIRSRPSQIRFLVLSPFRPFPRLVQELVSEQSPTQKISSNTPASSSSSTLVSASSDSSTSISSSSSSTSSVSLDSTSSVSSSSCSSISSSSTSQPNCSTPNVWNSDDSESLLSSLDAFQVIQLLQTASAVLPPAGSASPPLPPLTATDFVPARLGMVMEPFLRHLGYGSYHLRPSPLCAFGTLLLNTKRLHSVPLPRIFDVGRFYRNMLPLLPQFEREDSIGFILAHRLKWIIKKCPVLPNPFLSSFPDVLSYLSDKSKIPTGKKVVNQMQFILIHNNMDFACIDLLRRSQCSVMVPLSPGESKLVSQCSGCI